MNTPKTIAEIRAEIAAAKKLAMSNFTRTWGTDDVLAVWGALRQTIPNSHSPSDAAIRARGILRAGNV